MSNVRRIHPHWYEIIDEIGDGGYGNVYKATEVLAEDVLALKVLKPEELSEQAMERFQREIRIHSKLKHNNIVPILSFDLDDSLPSENGRGLAYYTMPLADENLRDFMIRYRMDNLGNMDDETAVFYFNQVLDGIDYAHKSGIIHRDLKPENILVYHELGEPVLKISDFGLGKFLNGTTNLTRTQVGLGSDVYAAPEQYRDSRDVDESADIYSLGKILYELITYDLPVSIDYEKINDSRLRFIIRKATKTNKFRRFASIQEMKDRINMVLGLNTALKTSTNQFKALYERYNTNNQDILILKQILELLIKYKDDYTLYTESFMNMDEADFQVMHLYLGEEFNEVVENYLSLLKGGHSYPFTDTIANFVFNNLIPRLEDNLDLYEKAFESVLKMGHSHNRYYIGRIFGDEISKVTNQDHILIIGEVLENNTRATDWAKLYFPNNLCDYLNNVIDSI